MNPLLSLIQSKVYNKCSLVISNFEQEPESKAYQACHFQLNNQAIVCRNAKTTPKKLGQFVTLWKRNKNHITSPYEDKDPVDLFVINVKSENQLGQFVFPKSVLIQKKILSTSNKDGKRAFRIYPPWVQPTSKQALKTQEWQLNYFFEIIENLDLTKIKQLYTL